jgi:hypothetical protein
MNIHTQTSLVTRNKAHSSSSSTAKMGENLSTSAIINDPDLLIEQKSSVEKNSDFILTLIQEVGSLNIEDSIDLKHKTQHLAHQLLHFKLSYATLLELLKAYIKNNSITQLLNSLAPNEGTRQLITMKQQLINHLLKSRFTPFNLSSEIISQNKPGTLEYKRIKLSIAILSQLHTTAIKQHWNDNTLLIKFIHDKKEFNPNQLSTDKNNRREPLSVRQIKKRIQIQKLLIAMDNAIYNPRELNEEHTALLCKQPWIVSFINMFITYDFPTANIILSALLANEKVGKTFKTALKLKLAENQFNLYQGSVELFTHLEKALSFLTQIYTITDPQLSEYLHLYKLITITYIKRKMNIKKHEADHFIYKIVNSHIQSYQETTTSQTIGSFFKTALDSSLSVLTSQTNPQNESKKRKYNSETTPYDFTGSRKKKFSRRPQNH